MFSPSDTEGPKVLLGQVLTFNSDPSNPENEHSFSYWERGFISIENGLISNAGKTADAPDWSTVVDYGQGLPFNWVIQ
ncbi:MAG TPA: hypothetical protein EYO32_09320 [Rhodospirillales bacterium]|nr:hypothetical protein [Rhodospirillales bacterium]